MLRIGYQKYKTIINIKKDLKARKFGSSECGFKVVIHM